MKYAFAAAALVAGVVAAPGWEKPEGYGAPSYESTSCTEEVWSTTPTAPAYESETSATWASTTWVESSSTPVPTPYQSSSTWVESSSVWSAESSSTWVETSSKPAPPPYTPTTWAESSSSTWVESSSSEAATSPYVPVPTPSGYTPAPSGYMPAPSGVAPSGTVGTIKPSSPVTAPTPSGSPITPYMGAANALNAAGLLAGVGAVVALFL